MIQFIDSESPPIQFFLISSLSLSLWCDFNFLWMKKKPQSHQLIQLYKKKPQNVIDWNTHSLNWNTWDEILLFERWFMLHWELDDSRGEELHFKNLFCNYYKWKRHICNSKKIVIIKLLMGHCRTLMNERMPWNHHSPRHLTRLSVRGAFYSIYRHHQTSLY